MGLVSVISPAGDDELLPGHVVPAGRFPSPCNGAGRSPRGCPAGLGAKCLFHNLSWAGQAAGHEG